MPRLSLELRIQILEDLVREQGERIQGLEINVSDLEQDLEGRQQEAYAKWESNQQ